MYLKYIISFVIIIIVVVCLYYLYSALKVSGQSISKKSDLNKDQELNPVPNNDQSTSYTYSTWIYINSYKDVNTGSTNKDGHKYYTIFCRSVKSTPSTKIDEYLSVSPLFTCLLELDSTVPTLTFHVKDKDEKVFSIVVTDNMPIQKWTCVTLCVSNEYIDSYLNGQLLQSNILKKTDANGKVDKIVLKTPYTGSDSGIYIGGQGGGNKSDIYLGELIYWNYQLSPKEVSNFYMSGNPGKSSANPFSVSEYGAQMVLLKNNIQSGVVSIL